MSLAAFSWCLRRLIWCIYCRYIGYLADQLEKHNLTEVVNTFILSDHGMTETDVHRIIDLNEFTDNSTYLRVGTSPVVHIFPHKGKHNYSTWSEKNLNGFFFRVRCGAKHFEATQVGVETVQDVQSLHQRKHP